MTPDAAIPGFMDATVDAAPDHTCFGTLAIDRVCFANADLPTTSTTITTDVTYNTGDATGHCATATLASNQVACVIAATSFTIAGSGRLHVVGDKPAVFVATTGPLKLDAGGVLDASTYGAQVGAGATTTCPGATDPVHAGGGYGGSFASLGGTGGVGPFDDSVGGLPPSAIATSSLHGGCPGGIGEDSGTNRALGGGAIALIAGTIQTDGTVVASGDGGQAAIANNNSGGNGGGAGGMIVVDAMTQLKGNGTFAARGGGGAQGRGGMLAGNGEPGYSASDPLANSEGGHASSSTGGPGGDGGPQTDNGGLAGGGGTSAAGGGGGGGAAGVIVLSNITPATSLTFVPPAI